jgi:hypothetical protein
MLAPERRSPLAAARSNEKAARESPAEISSCGRRRIRRKSPRANLFYILAYVLPDEPNQFFVLTQKQTTRLIKQELARLGRRMIIR